MSNIYTALGPEGLANYRVDWSGDQPVFEKVHNHTETILVPGFVDLHIHGAFDIDTMDADGHAMSKLADALEREGYEGFLATTITATFLEVKQALDAIPLDPRILGVHLEGPFISPKYPGAQPPQAIFAYNNSAAAWKEIVDDPQVKLVTLAPETPGALDLITLLKSRGALISLGHTDADWDQARYAFEHGATNLTHTFNAMRGLHHRTSSALGYALTNDSMFCELIYDRVHVNREAAALLFKAKPVDKVIAVSDGTRSIGLAPGTNVEMWGHACRVEKDRVVLAESGTLAGSTITLRDAFQNLWEDFGLETAIRCCCLNPRAVLGMTGPPKVWVELGPKAEVIKIRKLA